MVKYCLDTSIVIEIFRGNKEIIKKVGNLQMEEINFFVTHMTLCELYKGAFLHSKKEEKLKEIDELMLSCTILDFSIKSCKLFGEIYSDLRKSGNLIPESDLIIAAIARSNDLILVTRDKKHFENTNVRLEVW